MTQPLAGRTVLVTRPAHQAAALVQAIRAAGGEAFEFPALDIEAVPPGSAGMAREPSTTSPALFAVSVDR